MTGLREENGSIPVQLTRMEGVLIRVLERTTDLTTRMGKSEDRVTNLETTTQRLELNAKSSAESAIVLAEGVEKERESAAAAILKEKDKDLSRWTPFTRFIAALALSVSIMAVYIQYRSTR